MSEKPEKLESFKIGDLKPAAAANRVKPKQQESEEEPAQSLGFARIEAILDHEEPDVIRANLDQIRELLEAYGEGSTALKDKTAAQKGLLALSHTQELLEYLFQIKQGMGNAAELPQK